MKTLLLHLQPRVINRVAIIVAFCLVHGFSYSQKTLIITEIMSNPVSVSDAAGEWFEIYNVGKDAVQLNGFIISSGSSSVTITSASPLYIGASKFFVFGLSSDFALNGGVKVDYVYSTISLANAADDLAISNANNVIIDKVIYSSTKPGISRSLSPFHFEYRSSEDNLDWGDAGSFYNTEDKGTPGSMNDFANIDTDNDGVSDFEEINIGIDPNDPDTDDDGLSDAIEIGVMGYYADTSTKTDPLRVDSDNGGVRDGEEDENLNGKVDLGEKNPLDPSDDLVTGSMDELIVVEQFKLYPQPAFNVVCVSSLGAYKIYNQQGVIVAFGQVDDFKIDISSLNSGFYHLFLNGKVSKLMVK